MQTKFLMIMLSILTALALGACGGDSGGSDKKDDDKTGDKKESEYMGPSTENEYVEKAIYDKTGKWKTSSCMDANDIKGFNKSLDGKTADAAIKSGYITLSITLDKITYTTEVYDAANCTGNKLTGKNATATCSFTHKGTKTLSDGNKADKVKESCNSPATIGGKSVYYIKDKKLHFGISSSNKNVDPDGYPNAVEADIHFDKTGNADPVHNLKGTWVFDGCEDISTETTELNNIKTKLGATGSNNWNTTNMKSVKPVYEFTSNTQGHYYFKAYSDTSCSKAIDLGSYKPACTFTHEGSIQANTKTGTINADKTKMSCNNGQFIKKYLLAIEGSKFYKGEKDDNTYGTSVDKTRPYTKQ